MKRNSRRHLLRDLGVSATDFNAPAHVIEHLIESGRTSAIEFLDGAVRP